MTIVKRIVQTHHSESFAQESRATWQAHHPDFEYQFFDDAACRALIAERFPPLLPTYDKLPRAVQKADLFRYAAIYDAGGIYADTDTRCCAPLSSYLDMEAEHLVVGIEMTPAIYARGMDAYLKDYCLPQQLLQWTFAASAGHPALALVLKRIQFNIARMTSDQLQTWSQSDRFTLELTGPMLFSQVCNEFLAGTRKGAITVLPRFAWGAWLGEQKNPSLLKRIKVQHLFEGSWKSNPTNTSVQSRGESALPIIPGRNP